MCEWAPSHQRFWGVKRTIERVRPPLVILENVKGLDRRDPEADDDSSCLDRIVAELEGIPGYVVTVVTFAPDDLDYPIRRTRYWFVMFRKVAANSNAVDEFRERIRTMKIGCSKSLKDFLTVQS